MEDEKLELEAQDNKKLTRKRCSSSRENHHPYDHEEPAPQQPPPLQPQQPWKEEDGDQIFPPPEIKYASNALTDLVRKESEQETNRAPLEKVPEPEPVLGVEEKVETTVELLVPVPMSMPMPTKRVSRMHTSAEFEDNFLKASQSASEVSKMLEVVGLDYHSNFGYNPGKEVVDQ